MSTETAKTPVSAPIENGLEPDQEIVQVAERRRLYIGNLNYDATKETLQKVFEGYSVESIAIPVNPRTSRPVGYAFVDLSTAEEAAKAIEQLNGNDILDRKVSVQLARKPESTEGGSDGPKGSSKFRGSKNRGKGPVRRRGPKPDGEKADENGAKTNNDVTITYGDDGKAKDNSDGQQASTEAKKKRPSKALTTTLPIRQRGPPQDGVPSKTKVMVANLPYDLNEEKLKELFSAYNPTFAKIALRPIPRFMVKKLQERNEPRKGRGFGFVTLESEEMQKKACEEMNGKSVEGREIAVKVAIDSPGKEDDHDGDDASKANYGAENTIPESKVVAVSA